MPVPDVAVRVAGHEGVTDKAGRFSVDVGMDGEVQVAVESKKYSSGSGPVINKSSEPSS